MNIVPNISFLIIRIGIGSEKTVKVEPYYGPSQALIKQHRFADV